MRKSSPEVGFRKPAGRKVVTDGVKDGRIWHRVSRMCIVATHGCLDLLTERQAMKLAEDAVGAWTKQELKALLWCTTLSGRKRQAWVLVSVVDGRNRLQKVMFSADQIKVAKSPFVMVKVDATTDEYERDGWVNDYLKRAKIPEELACRFGTLS